MENLEKVIEVRNLTKKYKNFQAVKGISFSVGKGEVFGILGPNGAGKTTTLEIMEGLKEQTAGNCMVLGFDNLKETKEIKSRIGVQLQSSAYLANLNLKELIDLFAALYGKKVDAIALLKKFGLENKAKNAAKELSGGQKQRFTIATTLVHNPEIIFLDEPTTGLDPKARRDLWEIIRELNHNGTTIVLTTHYMEEAEYLCDRVAVMDQGKILEIDSPEGLIEKLAGGYKLSFFVDRPLPEKIFAGLKTVQKIYSELPKIIVELWSLEELNAIITELKQKNVAYKFLTLKTGTLEDVYLRLTGHNYEEE